MSTTAAAAYSTCAGAWADGPMRVYGPLAEELVRWSPIDVRGRTVLDHGAGTGAASCAAVGTHVVAVDHAIGMLLDGRAERPPATVGDALALPFKAEAFDVVIAAFSLNHLLDLDVGIREAARVAREHLLASTFAADDDHPVRRAAEDALVELGWSPPAWYREAAAAMGSLGTVDAAAAVIEQCGLTPELVERLDVPFPHLTPLDLVRWRLGMAQCAAFVATHDARALEARTLELLGDGGPLVRSVIFIAARVR